MRRDRMRGRRILAVLTAAALMLQELQVLPVHAAEEVTEPADEDGYDCGLQEVTEEDPYDDSLDEETEEETGAPDGQDGTEKEPEENGPREDTEEESDGFGAPPAGDDEEAEEAFEAYEEEWEEGSSEDQAGDDEEAVDAPEADDAEIPGADGGGAEAVDVSDLAGLKAALADPSVKEISLTADDTETVRVGALTASGYGAVVKGQKTLHLGASLRISGCSGMKALILVGEGAVLKLDGSGSLEFTPVSGGSDSDGSAIFSIAEGGEFHATADFSGRISAMAGSHLASASCFYAVYGSNLVLEGPKASYSASCGEDVYRPAGGIIYDPTGAHILLKGGYYEGNSYVFYTGNNDNSNIRDYLYKDIMVGTGTAGFNDRSHGRLSSLSLAADSEIYSETKETEYYRYSMTPFDSEDLAPGSVFLNGGESGTIRFVPHKFTLVGCKAKVKRAGEDLEFPDAGKGEEISFPVSVTDAVPFFTDRIIFEYSYSFDGREYGMTLERDIYESRGTGSVHAGTKEDPVPVSTYPQLARALADPDVDHVRIDKDIDAMRLAVSIEDMNRFYQTYRMTGNIEALEEQMAASGSPDVNFDAVNSLLGADLSTGMLWIRDTKHLILEHDLTIRSLKAGRRVNSDAYGIFLREGSCLTVSGTGTYRYISENPPEDGRDTAAVGVSGAELILEGGNIEAKISKSPGLVSAVDMYGKQAKLTVGEGFGRITAESGRSSASVLEGFTTAAVLMGYGSSAYISGGVFDQTEAENPDLSAGLALFCTRAEGQLYYSCGEIKLYGGYFPAGIKKYCYDQGSERNVFSNMTVEEIDALVYSGSKVEHNFVPRYGWNVDAVTVSSATPVKSVNIDSYFNTPMDGAEPVFEKPAGSGWKTDEVRWTDLSSGKALAAGDKFLEDHRYRLELDLSSTGKYVFSDVTEAGFFGTVVELVRTGDKDVRLYRTMVWDYGPCASQLIRKVEILYLAMPEYGKKISECESFAVTTGGIGVKNVSWSEKTADGSWDPKTYPTDTFGMGKEYRAGFALTTEYTYSFDLENIQITVNGEPVQAEEGSSAGALFFSRVYTPEPVILSSIKVSGLRAPEAGKTPDNEVEVEGIFLEPDPEVQPYVSWRNATDGRDMKEDDSFEAGKTYLATISLAIRKDNGLSVAEFGGELQTYVNGEPARVSVLSMGSGFISIEAEYLCPGASGNITIPYVELSIQAPAIGAEPSKTVTLNGDGYDVYTYLGEPSVTWTDLRKGTEFTSGQFEENGEYGLQITLTARDGYEFATDDNGRAAAAAAVNGRPAEVYGGNGKSMSISMHFPVLERPNTAGYETDPVLEYQKYSYTGMAVTPEFELYDNGERLVRGRDYTVKYSNNVKVTGAKRAKVQISLKGNRKGKLSYSFDIVAGQMSEEAVKDGLFSATPVYGTVKAGKKQELKPVICCGGRALKLNRDYTLEYNDSREGAYTKSGEWEITVRGKEPNFTGSYTVSEVLVDPTGMQDLAKANVKPLVEKPDVLTDAQQDIKVWFGDGSTPALTEGVDYTVYYGGRNGRPGTVKCIVSAVPGNTKYYGSRILNIKVSRCDLRKCAPEDIVVSVGVGDSTEYLKGGAKPYVTVKVRGGSTDSWHSLKEGTDYKLKFSSTGNALRPGKAKITGMGNYSGSVTKEFAIKQKDVNSLRIFTGDADAKNGADRLSYIIMDLDGRELKKNRDYTASVRDNGDGTGILTISGQGNYTGSRDVKFRIRTASSDVGKAKISFMDTNNGKVKAYTYTGKAIEPDRAGAVVLNEGKYRLTPADFEVAGYVNNYEAGTAVIIIRGKGSYSGIKAYRFKIAAKEGKN
ncbi:MAG: hypothetical protein IKI75_11010 [Lachnospiraceae bacterium]|nr:hypothetical protein [Lachnospiraceae bacterium]